MFHWMYFHCLASLETFNALNAVSVFHLEFEDLTFFKLFMKLKNWCDSVICHKMILSVTLLLVSSSQLPDCVRLFKIKQRRKFEVEKSTHFHLKRGFEVFPAQSCPADCPCSVHANVELTSRTFQVVVVVVVVVLCVWFFKSIFLQLFVCHANYTGLLVCVWVCVCLCVCVSWR